MIDIEKQKRIGIKQAKATIANIYKKANGRKLTQQEFEAIAKQQAVLNRWERAGKRGWKL